MNRLMHDGTADPHSREQTLRRVRGQRKFSFLQLITTRIGKSTRLVPSLLNVITTHTHTQIHIRWIERLDSGLAHFPNLRMYIRTLKNLSDGSDTSIVGIIRVLEHYYMHVVFYFTPSIQISL